MSDVIHHMFNDMQHWFKYILLMQKAKRTFIFLCFELQLNSEMPQLVTQPLSNFKISHVDLWNFKQQKKTSWDR